MRLKSVGIIAALALLAASCWGQEYKLKFYQGYNKSDGLSDVKVRNSGRAGTHAPDMLHSYGLHVTKTDGTEEDALYVTDAKLTSSMTLQIDAPSTAGAALIVRHREGGFDLLNVNPNAVDLTTTEVHPYVRQRQSLIRYLRVGDYSETKSYLPEGVTMDGVASVQRALIFGQDVFSNYAGTTFKPVITAGATGSKVMMGPERLLVRSSVSGTESFTTFRAFPIDALISVWNNTTVATDLLRLRSQSDDGLTSQARLRVTNDGKGYLIGGTRTFEEAEADASYFGMTAGGLYITHRLVAGGNIVTSGSLTTQLTSNMKSLNISGNLTVSNGSFTVNSGGTMSVYTSAWMHYLQTYAVQQRNSARYIKCSFPTGVSPTPGTIHLKIKVWTGYDFTTLPNDADIWRTNHSPEYSYFLAYNPSSDMYVGLPNTTTGYSYTAYTGSHFLYYGTSDWWGTGWNNAYRGYPGDVTDDYFVKCYYSTDNGATWVHYATDMLRP